MNKPEIISDGELAYLREANMSLGSFSKGGFNAQSPKNYMAAIGKSGKKGVITYFQNSSGSCKVGKSGKKSGKVGTPVSSRIFEIHQAPAKWEKVRKNWK